MTLKVVGVIHLHRFIIKSEYAKLYIPEIEFEIPPQTQKGSMSTIEGILRKSIEDLQEMQEERRKVNKDLADKIDSVLAKLEDYANGTVMPFTVILIDPSGNSFIQNPNAPKQDSYLKAENFVRTKEEAVEMGFAASDPDANQKEEEKKQIPDYQSVPTSIGAKKDANKKPDLLNKLIADEDYCKSAASFPTECYACTMPGEARSCTVNIPYFKELIIMSFYCESCGFKSVDTVSGGGISEKKTIYTFNVKGPEELNREVFKSNSCIIDIPELDLSMQAGTISSMFSTVEGILEKIQTTIEESFPFTKSDSSPEMSKNFIKFSANFHKFKANGGFTLILTDPLSNTFINNPHEPDPDPLLKKELVNRTSDEDDELGINDLKV
jgi:zinc finger protein